MGVPAPVVESDYSILFRKVNVDGTFSRTDWVTRVKAASITDAIDGALSNLLDEKIRQGEGDEFGDVAYWRIVRVENASAFSLRP